MPGFFITGVEDCADNGPMGDQGDVPRGTVETARKYRFEFSVFEPLEDILIYAHRAQRPRPEIDSITIHHSQEEIYTPGKNRWMPIDISFYEAVQNEDDQVASLIYDWWSTNVLDINNSVITSNEYKKDCELTMLDGENNVIWKYAMYGCWPPKITPDDVDYSDTTIAEISFTLKMDKAQEFNGE